MDCFALFRFASHCALFRPVPLCFVLLRMSRLRVALLRFALNRVALLASLASLSVANLRVVSLCFALLRIASCWLTASRFGSLIIKVGLGNGFVRGPMEQRSVDQPLHMCTIGTVRKATESRRIFRVCVQNPCSQLWRDDPTKLVGPASKGICTTY